MVVAAGVTVTAIPLVADRFPGVMTPVPLEKTPVRVALCPTVMVVGLATKLAMEAGGGGVGVLEPPPQPVNTARQRETARAGERAVTPFARAVNIFMRVLCTLNSSDFTTDNDTAIAPRFVHWIPYSLSGVARMGWRSGAMTRQPAAMHVLCPKAAI